MTATAGCRAIRPAQYDFDGVRTIGELCGVERKRIAVRRSTC